MTLRIQRFPVIISLLLLLLINACTASRKSGSSTTTTSPKPTTPSNTPGKPMLSPSGINIDGLLWYAKKQLGTPYLYGSADPAKGGLDCSGFLYYVFNHFKIKVPRTSKDYMSYGKPVSRSEAQKGDVIIFTGSDATVKTGGHVGLILENTGNDITFIHGSSSKKYGVMINKLSDAYYNQRFLKIVRVIP